ncbi:MAG: enoyl-CoA hydratase/isomerase family protein [Deltaproteobacteria bacterium]|nr:enoyl-CoA hydratase/isomerase family protein [Deltaproteobacteria bacterium]MBI3390297.1 enoyl-CoA hydratase/isomerase family protein [Deltaproteobacteria bacterium]
MLHVESSNGIARLTLARPEVGNALNDEVAERVISALAECRRDGDLRAVVLAAEGKVFSAGADLNWMRRMKGASFDDNVRDATRTAELFAALYEFPRPVIARVNGPARGGGVGLIAACDFAIGATAASFAFTEVRLGVVPAVISPYCIKKLGEARCRRLFLTGEVFSAQQAQAWGLLDDVCPSMEDVDSAIAQLLATLNQCAPEALGVAKALLRGVADRSLADAKPFTADIIARIRTGAEAQEGMAAFLEKRKPAWVKR